MRGLFFLIIIGLAGAVWYQQIELKKHHVRTDPAHTLAIMGEKIGRTTREVSKDAQKGVDEMTDTLGKKFGHIMKETDVREEENNEKRRRK